MDKQAKEARKMAKDLPFKEKVSYIWMYYKWWIIGVLAVAIAISGTAHEIISRPIYDVEIAYYTDKPVSDDTIASMEEYFSQFIDDVDGDGQKSVKIYNSSLSIAGDDATMKMTIQSKFVAELASKAYPVYLFDDTFAEIIKQDTYKDSFDELIDISTYDELKQRFGIKDGEHVYWAARTLYQAEENDQKRQAEYAMIKAAEKNAFNKLQ